MRTVILTISLVLPLSMAFAESHPTRAYFGDTHLHTSYSPDARR